MAAYWIWPTVGRARPRPRLGTLLMSSRTWDAQAEASSARLHPQKYQVHCKPLWIVCLEISEGLSCSGKEEQTGTLLSQSPCRKSGHRRASPGGGAFLRYPAVGAHQNPDTSCRVNSTGVAHAAIRIQCAKGNENPVSSALQRPFKPSRCRAYG